MNSNHSMLLVSCLFRTTGTGPIYEVLTEKAAPINGLLSVLILGQARDQEASVQ